MKSWCKLFGILALLPSILIAAEANPADAAKLREIKEVSWPKAYREGDGALLDKILATEFQMVDDSGTVSNKREELDYISKNRPSYKSFRYEITRLDVFENRTAVVAGTGRLEFDATDKAKAHSIEYKSSNVFLERDGRWQAIASHVSGIKKTER